LHPNLYLHGLVGQWGLKPFNGITTAPILNDERVFRGLEGGGWSAVADIAIAGIFSRGVRIKVTTMEWTADHRGPLLGHKDRKGGGKRMRIAIPIAAAAMLFPVVCYAQATFRPTPVTAR
jgi:hypothetical protein